MMYLKFKEILSFGIQYICLKTQDFYIILKFNV